MNIEKVVENLKKNNINAIVVSTKEEALNTLISLLPEGATVSHGGSVTLNECGVTNLLKNGKYNYLDRSAVEDPNTVYAQTATADVYLTSCNAVTENGELYNVDGYANRVSAIAFGPKKVIMIVGQNKIVPTLEDAVIRVKTVAAPKNAKRLNCNTYCAKVGKCVSLNQSNPSMTDGCESDARICRQYLVTGRQKTAERITVILVLEDLGY